MMLRLLLAASLCAGVAAPLRAVEVRPPLLAMSDSQMQLVAGAILAVDSQPPSILFRIDEALRGDGQGEVRLRVAPQDLPMLAPGEGFLAVFSDVMPAPLKPRKFIRVPEQARLLSFEGVEVSLFRDSPAWRALLARDPLKAAASPGYRQQVLAGLADSDPQMADLWSGELALRAQRLSPFAARELASIDAFVRSAQAPARARARLLLLAHDRRPLLGTDWPVAAAAVVLAQVPAQAEPPAALQALVQSALLVLTAHPRAIEPATVAPWLASTPVLAELAALALRARAPEAEAAALDAVLARPLLPAATRTFLEQHRQRLHAQQAAASASDGERRGP